MMQHQPIILNQGEEDMQPVSILQWLIFQIGHTCVQYPKRCRLCGRKTKGNRITGFYFSCNCEETMGEVK